MRKITIAILALVLVGMLIPTGFATDSNLVITYGESTNANSNYKSIVDSFFTSQANVNLGDVNSKVITADQVNQISSGITGKSYSSNQIYSSALLDLNDNDNLQVSVDKSKITTITGDMYISALKSAGITSGHVYVTSPVTATGESALAGIMKPNRNSGLGLLQRGRRYCPSFLVICPDSVREAMVFAPTGRPASNPIMTA